MLPDSKKQKALYIVIYIKYTALCIVFVLGRKRSVVGYYDYNKKLVFIYKCKDTKGFLGQQASTYVHSS